MTVDSLASWISSQLRVFRTGWVTLAVVAILGFSFGLLQGANQLSRTKLPKDDAASWTTENADTFGETYGYAPSTDLPPSGPVSLYIVQRGDSTWQLADEFLGSGKRYGEIEELNGLAHNQWLSEGEWLVLPPDAAVSQRDARIVGTMQLPAAEVAMPSATNDETFDDSDSNTDRVDEYSSLLVLPEETLSSLAHSEFGTEHAWHVLYVYNSAVIGPDANLLRPAAVLRIPKIEYNQNAPSTDS